MPKRPSERGKTLHCAICNGSFKGIDNFDQLKQGPFMGKQVHKFNNSQGQEYFRFIGHNQTFYHYGCYRTRVNQKSEREQAQQRYEQQLAQQEQQQRQQRAADQRRYQQQLAQHQQKLKAEKKRSFEKLQSQKHDIIRNKLNPTKKELTIIKNQIQDEEKAISGMKLERNDKSKKIIICIGKTGHGKSAFVNRLAGDTSLMANAGPCRTSNAAQSCTNELQKVYDKNKEICIIDCPGWADTGGADRKHANNLCAFLKGCGGINGIVLVRSATEYRFDADFKYKLDYLADIFGNNFWSNIIIVLTHVDKGMNEKQFVENKKEAEMRREVQRQSGQNVAYPVIPIGLDNYEKALRDFRKNVKPNRFTPDRIRSPIDQLKQRKQQVIDQKQKIKEVIDGIDNEMKELQSQIDNL